MKKVMFALCFMFGGIALVMAQDNQDTTSNQYRTETQSQYPQDAQGQDLYRQRIQSTELPEEVKRALEGQEYRGWLVSGAFKADPSSMQSDMQSDTTSTDAGNQGNNNALGAEQEELYIIELKNGAETKTVAFDKSGQEIELEEIQSEGLNNESDQGDQRNRYNQEDQLNQDQQDPNAQPGQEDQLNEGNQYNQEDQLNQDQQDPNAQPGQEDQLNERNQFNDEQMEQNEETAPDQTTPDQTSPESDQPGSGDADRTDRP